MHSHIAARAPNIPVTHVHTVVYALVVHIAHDHVTMHPFAVAVVIHQ